MVSFSDDSILAYTISWYLIFVYNNEVELIKIITYQKDDCTTAPSKYFARNFFQIGIGLRKIILRFNGIGVGFHE